MGIRYTFFTVFLKKSAKGVKNREKIEEKL
jgi:hypothetical protein